MILLAVTLAFAVGCQKTNDLMGPDHGLDQTTDLKMKSSTNGTVQVVSNEYIVVAKDMLFDAALKSIGQLGGAVMYESPELNLIHAASTSSSFVKDLQNSGNVSDVMPNLMIDFDIEGPSAQAVSPSVATPNTNTYYGYQWAHQAINSEGAWDAGYTGAEVLVGVIDGGFHPNHPDLQANVSVANSYSAVDGEPVQSANPYAYHGTHVSGIIAAVDNDMGVIGVAPDAKIAMVKVLNDFGSGTTIDVIEGIMWAANNPNIDVLNMSIGFALDWKTFDKKLTNFLKAEINMINDAVNYANRMGKLSVVSAGNSGVDPVRTQFIALPANSPKSLSVSALGPKGWIFDPSTDLDELSSYSNYGPIVDVAGSGGDFTLYPNDGWFFDMVLSCGHGPSGYGYYFAAGTSMSAPQVTGVAALILGKYPNLTPNQLKAKIYQSADDLGKKGRDDTYGHGRVNAYNAVK